MSKPVENDEFWKVRLAEAEKEGRLHLSVYRTHPEDWEYLCGVHKKVVKHFIPDDARVLDIGCGYGRLSEWFVNYTGIDISESLIRKAEKLYPYANFFVGDIKQMPFKDKEFDWAILVSIKGMIIREIGDVEWLKMEKEIKRIAKNVLILEYSSPADYEIL